MSTIFTFEKLYKAYRDCLKRKKKTANALKFEIHREKNLQKLLYDLRTRKYKISRHICFVITEPSVREIFAADFRDRIVHHLLCNEIQDIFEKDFSDNSYANRKKFGTHRAIKKLKRDLARGGNNGNRLYFLKMDIKSFFRSIDKDILWKIVENKIISQSKPAQWKDDVLWLSKIIIFNDPTDSFVFKGELKTKKLVPREKSLLCGDSAQGLPIGNLTSQFFANVYLNELDQYVENDLGIKRYFRYVDDFILLDEDMNLLKDYIGIIKDFCHVKLKLKIAHHKTILRKTGLGVDFVGYFVKPTHTLIRKTIVSRLRRTIVCKRFLEDIKYKKSCVASYLGHFGHANSYGLKNYVKKLTI